MLNTDSSESPRKQIEPDNTPYEYCIDPVHLREKYQNIKEDDFVRNIIGNVTKISKQHSSNYRLSSAIAEKRFASIQKQPSGEKIQAVNIDEDKTIKNKRVKM